MDNKNSKKNQQTRQTYLVLDSNSINLNIQVVITIQVNNTWDSNNTASNSHCPCKCRYKQAISLKQLHLSIQANGKIIYCPSLNLINSCIWINRLEFLISKLLCSLCGNSNLSSNSRVLIKLLTVALCWNLRTFKDRYISQNYITCTSPSKESLNIKLWWLN